MSKLGVFAGLSTIDLSYVVPRLPVADEKVVATAQALAAGGPATNAAATFAFLGGQAYLVSSIGHHPLAQIQHHDLRRLGVKILDVAPNDSDLPPIVSSILTVEDSGSRAIVSAGGGDGRSRLAPTNLTTPIHAADVLLLDGHYMSLALDLAREARKNGVLVVLDGGSWKDGTDDLLLFVDIAICSADFVGPNGEQEHDLLDYLRNQGVRFSAITRGSDSTLFRNEDEFGLIAVRRIKAIDTLGAGDIFHGAFCWHLVHTRSFEQALRYASEVATASCQFFGTRSWMRQAPPSLFPIDGQSRSYG